jgi:FecR-like protein
MKRALSTVLSLLLAASATAQAPAASLLAKIGTAAAVRGSVKATSSGSAVGHVISSGKPLFLNDHVTTDAAGRLQVLLVDETIFTLGPNSDMVLDEFVYDPKTSAGKLTASISKGTFRFVTGKIAQKDPSTLKIKVAVGTIGVRGSIGVGETGPNGTTIINGGARVPDNHDDAAGIYAQSNGKTVNLIQPGVGTHIGPDGTVGKARFMTDDLNRIMGTLQNKIGAGHRNAAVMAGRTASSASGRSVSIGGEHAADTQQTLDDAKSADIIATLAQQAATEEMNSNTASVAASIPDGVANWNQVPLTGSGSYSGSGTYAVQFRRADFGRRLVVHHP